MSDLVRELVADLVTGILPDGGLPANILATETSEIITTEAGDFIEADV